MACRNTPISNKLNILPELKEPLTKQSKGQQKQELWVVKIELHQGRRIRLIMLWMRKWNVVLGIQRRLNLFMSRTSRRSWRRMHLGTLSNKNRGQNMSRSREEMARKTVQHWSKGHQQRRVRWWWRQRRTISKGLMDMDMRLWLHSYDYHRSTRWRCPTMFRVSILKWWMNTLMLMA